MKEVLKGHRQIQGVVERLKLRLRRGGKALKGLNVLRDLKLRHQGGRLVLPRLPAVHGVDAEALDGLLLLRGQGRGDRSKHIPLTAWTRWWRIST